MADQSITGKVLLELYEMSGSESNISVSLAIFEQQRFISRTLYNQRRWTFRFYSFGPTRSYLHMSQQQPLPTCCNLREGTNLHLNATCSPARAEPDMSDRIVLDRTETLSMLP